MRQTLTLLFTFLCVLLASCEHPDLSDESTAQEPKGNLTVSVFSIEQMPFSALFTRAAASQACNRLSFAIYDASNTRIKQTNQMLGDDDFGTASFQLAEGTYFLVAVAHSSNGNPTMTDPLKIKFTNSQGFSDTFLYARQITVSSEPQTIQLSLDRIVALCRFVITDDYPQAVKQMRFQYKGGSGAFDAHTGLGSVNSTQTLFFDATTGQKQFDLYTFLHDTEGTIHLLATAYDANVNVLFEREFDVPLRQNQVTLVSGPYFSANGSSSFNTLTSSVDINTTWSGQTTINY